MDIGDWLSQSITVQSPIGSDNYGSPTWGTKVTIPARIETVDEKTVSADGSVVRLTDRIFTVDVVTVNDRIWLPGADSNDAKQARRPIKVNGHPELDGSTSFYTVML